MARQDRRGFGSVRLRNKGGKNSRWEARYTDPKGIRRSAPETFETRLAAEAWLVELRRQMDRDLWDATAADRPNLLKFEAYARNWVQVRRVKGEPLRPRTKDHYLRLLEKYLLPEFGTKPVIGISTGMVNRWYNELLPDAPVMRSHCYALLRGIMATAVSEELIDASPCRIRGATSSTRSHKIRPISPKQIEALTEAMPDELRLMIILGSWCSMRYGECIELRRGDIDLENEMIFISRAAYRVGGTFDVGDPKTDAGIRDVGIPPHVIPYFEHHLDNHVGDDDDALLFTAVGSNGHLQPSTFNRHYYAAREAIKRPDLRYHDLRHSGAVLAAKAGATLAELKDRLGHTTFDAAMRYQHLAEGARSELADKMSKLAGT